MDNLFVDFMERLETLNQDMSAAIQGLGVEALNWYPGEAMNSLAVLVTHTCGAERYWAGEMTGWDPIGRDRPAEFRVEDLDEKALQQDIDRTRALVRKAVAGLSLADLPRQFQSSLDGQSYSVAWSLLHALEHTAVHLGQMQLTRQLWDQRKPAA